MILAVIEEKIKIAEPEHIIEKTSGCKDNTFDERKYEKNHWFDSYHFECGLSEW